jgi:hypothetical protein
MNLSIFVNILTVDLNMENLWYILNNTLNGNKQE